MSINVLRLPSNCKNKVCVLAINAVGTIAASTLLSITITLLSSSISEIFQESSAEKQSSEISK